MAALSARGRLAAALLALALAAPSGVAHGQAPKPPNLVVLLADDLTHGDIGCYGGQARTPSLDRLAGEGLRFTRCFQAAPMCSPTRHALYTGLYPVRSGAYPNHAVARAGTRSIVHHLARLGYRVALGGKLHVAPPEVYPFERCGDGSPDFAAIERLLVECRRARTPFCLFVCSSEPHGPWERGDAASYPAAELRLPAVFVDTPETRAAYARYLAEVSVFDAEVGRTLDLLDAHDLAADTLVVVLSEQGASFPFAKWTLYDAGIQSACVVRWPGRVAAGRTSDALIEYVDLVPTLVEAAGGTAPPELDGRSFLALLEGRAERHKEHVYALMTTRGIAGGTEHFGIRSVRSERFKYIRNLTPEVEFKSACTASKVFRSWLARAAAGDPAAAERTRRYAWRPAEELYDLGVDPGEWTNLAADPAVAGVKAELRAKLDAWMAAQGDRGQATELEALEHQDRTALPGSAEPEER
jgi:arylsulfatase A-like enzyme